jgi:hypothetical protein
VPRVKRFLTIFAGVAVGLACMGIFALTVQWLFFGNTTSMNVFNRSTVSLQRVTVMVPGSAFSSSPVEMPPGGDVVFSADTRMVLPIRVVFNADGHHYEAFRRVILPPIGAHIISIYIDQQMQISIRPRILL